MTVGFTLLLLAGMFTGAAGDTGSLRAARWSSWQPRVGGTVIMFLPDPSRWFRARRAPDPGPRRRRGPDVRLAVVGSSPIPSGQETAARTEHSRRLFERACAAIPGGVNSPGPGVHLGRRHAAVHGLGARVRGSPTPTATATSTSICSWGPMILGHAHPAVVEAVRAAAGDGLSFGAPTPGRDRAGRGDHRPGRAGRAGAAGQLRHRGDDERDPARPRDHRPARRRQVRRLLPRARRRAARPGRLRGRHARPADQPRRHRGAGRRHRSCCPTTTSTPCARCSPSAAPRSPA